MYPGESIMPSTPSSIISSKNSRTLLGIGAVEQSRVGRHAEAALQRFADSFNRLVVSAFAADGKIVMLAQTVHVTLKRSGTCSA